MKLIELTIQNFRKISAVCVNKLGNVIVFTGKNAMGKSSALGAIEALFRGASKDNIHKDSKSAEIVGTVGEYTIRRRITASNTTLDVTKSGVQIPKPAEFLASLVNNLAISPTGFFRLNDIDKTKAIMTATNTDLAEYEEAIKASEVERLRLSQEIKRVGTPTPVPKVEYVDITAIEEKNREIRRVNAEIYQLDTTLQSIRNERERIQARLKELKESENCALDALSSRTTQPETNITQLVEQNRQADQYKMYLKQVEVSQSLQKARASEDETITVLRAEMGQVFVEKLAPLFDGGSVAMDGKVLTVNGFKPTEWSHSETMRIAAKLGMASNPDAKVVLVDDAESLDDASIKELVAWAKSNDIQVIMSIREGIAVEGAENVIELVDGEVK